MKEQKRKGFSRWELLALGAVISIGAVLLVPVLAQSNRDQNAASESRANSCSNNLKQVSLGFLQYVQDYDERYPIIIVGAGSQNGNPPYGWADAIQPYIRSTQIYQCPSERNRGQTNSTLPGYTDYWYNANFSSLDLVIVRAPILNLLAGDGDGGSFNSNARYNLKSLPKSWIKTVNSPARRHLNQGCYAFADGHVERLAAKEVGTKAATFIVR